MSNVNVSLEIKMGKEGNIDSIEREEISVPDLYRMEIEHFSDCIVHNVPPMINSMSSLHNQEILERAVI